MLLILQFLRKQRRGALETVNLLPNGKLDRRVDLGLLALRGEWLTISFLRMEMLLASSSRMECSRFQDDSLFIRTSQ